MKTNKLDIQKLGTSAKKNKEICRYFMTYSYNKYEDVAMKNIKWVVIK
jgi:hypothetical protein